MRIPFSKLHGAQNDFLITSVEDVPGTGLEQLAIAHPVTGAEITITAPWPKDLTVAIKYLRRHAQPSH